MKILLVQPDSSPQNVGFNNLTMPEPLHLELVAGSVREHDVRILDMRIDNDLEASLREFQPDALGVTGFTADVPRAQAVCQKVRELLPTCRVIVGGHHASLRPEDFNLPSVDFIVVGEGEFTFPALIKALEGGSDPRLVAGVFYREDGRQVFTGARPPVKDLDQVPTPERSLTEKYRSNYYFRFWHPTYTLETARGCPYRCYFCSVWKFYQGKCRTKSPERVLQELSGIPGDYVCIVDDNFMQDIKRAERIYQLVKEAGIHKKYWMQARTDSIARHPKVIEHWAEIGLSTILVGFEKFREEELATLNKKSSIALNEKAVEIMHKYGVDIWGAFIVDPAWVEEDFTALINYVRSMKVDFPQFTILTPLPGTDFFQQKYDELLTHEYDHFDFFHSVLPTKLPLREFYENMARLYANTSMSLSELKNRIRRGDIPTGSLKRMRGMLSQLTNPDAYLRGADTP
ncbi:MAG: cobalamin-dependent protein [Dehalococcoidia bacterium]|nr:cobalamin-dependent protein [Dehalococcoidia bacterium]